MGNEHSYHVLAWWSSGKAGLAKCDSAPNALHFAAPPQFGGVEERWSPEDLLLCALASCFTTTFRTLADHSNFPFTDLEVDVQGTVGKVESGYAFSEIAIRPKLTITSDEWREPAARLLEKAKRLCIISRVLAVAQSFAPEIKIEAPNAQTSERLVGYQ